MSDLIQRESYARQELDTQITTAKMYPRNVEAFLHDSYAMVTLDQETAESCIYALPRKNKKGEQIKGESVRLAEIVASCWGNLHAATRIVENDGRTITAEAVAWDLEKNLKIAKQVQRSIVKSDGKTYGQDMQVVTGNAASSIALRNAILSVVPRSFVKKIYETAVNFAIGDKTKINQKINSFLERFKEMGIEESKILAYFNLKNREEITRAVIEEMIGIGTAIKEKTLPIDKAFVIEAETDVKVDSLNARLEAKPKDDNHKEFINQLDS
jgi:hypothetical protein